MKRLFTILALALSIQSQVLAQEKTTFLLVHGALFTAVGWEPLAEELQTLGYKTATVTLPGRGITANERPNLQDAAKAVCAEVEKLVGPVVLVGHSQGGAVITQSLQDCGNRVSGLVYVAAVIPLNNEFAFQMLNKERDTGFFRVAAEKDGFFEIKKDAPIREIFFQDLDEKKADSIIATMVNEPVGIGTTPASYPQDIFEQLPKLYVEALSDHVLSIETQRETHKRIANIQVASIDTGHSPFLTQPKALAQIIVGKPYHSKK